LSGHSKGERRAIERRSTPKDRRAAQAPRPTEEDRRARPDRRATERRTAGQRLDVILDITQTSEQLGKTAGKDTKAQKATYPAIVGIEKSKKIAQQLTRRAFAALKIFGGKAVALEALAVYLLQRDR